MEQNHLCKFGRRHQEEQFCKIILNFDQWFRRRCCLKIFLIWSSGGPFVQPSRTVCAILEKGIIRNNSVSLFRTLASGSGGQKIVVSKISYLELWQPSCSVERNNLCNFERGHHGEHSCEFILNLNQWFRRRCCLKI